MAELSFDE